MKKLQVNPALFANAEAHLSDIEVVAHFVSKLISAVKAPGWCKVQDAWIAFYNYCDIVRMDLRHLSGADPGSFFLLEHPPFQFSEMQFSRMMPGKSNPGPLCALSAMTEFLIFVNNELVHFEVMIANRYTLTHPMARNTRRMIRKFHAARRALDAALALTSAVRP